MIDFLKRLAAWILHMPGLGVEYSIIDKRSPLRLIYDSINENEGWANLVLERTVLINIIGGIGNELAVLDSKSLALLTKPATRPYTDQDLEQWRMMSKARFNTKDYY